VRLTPDGEAYYRRCVRLIADLEEAEGSFRNTAPKGLLRANLQGTLARHFVVPALPAFLAQYPEIELHLGEDDRLVDLVREGVDCVLRAGNLQDSSMVGRQVAQLEQVTVASPGYLARYGEPAEPAALAAHRAVNYISSATGKAVPLEFTREGSVGTMYLRSSGGVGRGHGSVHGWSAGGTRHCAGRPRYRIVGELAAGRLKIILQDYPPPPMPVSVLYPQSRQLSSRVRVFAQWLRDIFEAASGGSAGAPGRGSHG